MRLVVDTSILIDYLRGGKKGQNFIDQIESNHYEEVFIPTIVLFEIFSGKSTIDPKIIEKIINLLKNFKRIELDEEIAKRAGLIYRDLNRSLQVPDYIVAASALTIGGHVVTLNSKHFSQIPHLSIYPL